MNTPAHLIFAASAFGKPGNAPVTGAALIGAILPDLSLYLLAGWHLFILGTDPNYVFGYLYFSPEWVRIFQIDNSFILWGIALAFAIWSKSATATALCGAALLHLAFDFPLHHDDGRPHFWPMSDWIYDSPFSYWDHSANGQIIGGLEMGICLSLCAWLWVRFPTRLGRAMVALAALTQLAPVVIWMFVFTQ